MPGKIVIGAQWGDEGKGKYIDIFAKSADMVVRSQGGNNAGHTVVVGKETYKLHVIPSGILYKDCVNIIGPGVVVDPESILTEIDGLQQKGISTEQLYIDPRCHVIMPWHLTLDALSEKSRGNSDIGTTKKGIGPCYMDKAERSGIRMHDFINPDKLKTSIFQAGARKNEMITSLYHESPLDLDIIFEKYCVFADRLRPFVKDTTVMVYNAVKSDKNVLFEGAQGTLLDLDMGTYPYVTSSHPVTGGSCIGSGIGPTAIRECFGVVKAYTTRVGKGPFPTELFDEIGDYIRERGFEFGTTTGRARRTGWFDAVIARYSVRVNGLTELILNKIDPLSGLKTLKVCTAYKINGKIVSEFPADFSELEHCEPIYEEFEGFDGDITICKTYAELPASLRKYVEAIEEMAGCPIRMIGTGPSRDNVICR
ncbi:MAG: adenylosuccinate synthase [Clostridiales bacterium]|nr:adenylosuccinate synthase [Clostridiales bacterium]